MYDSVPAQLATGKRSYVISAATGKRKTDRDLKRFHDLLASKTVLPCYNVLNPSIALAQTKDAGRFKLYLADTGLFTTMIFSSSAQTDTNIYDKLLRDSLSADLGYLYENAAAQIIASVDRALCFHTWHKENSTHYYEIDFLLASGNKIVPVEVKSSGLGKHESINTFQKKYSKQVAQQLLISQKDLGHDGMLKRYPLYMLPFILEDL